MIRRTLLLVLSTAFCLAGLLGCGLLSPDASFAASHPSDTGAGRPQCSSCHDKESLKGAMKPYAAFDHTDAFAKDHRHQAQRDPGVCGSCHGQSFCADCHGTQNVMSPTARLGNRPDRTSPHRGNYVNLHRMDGKVDPTGCYKCHGRANNDKCVTCHR